uniref:Putative secreted peptide n=1 Tax=Anopheles braziliensis TaxID=58242 RepID=A0A2M3ZNJ8_9DIPT
MGWQAKLLACPLAGSLAGLIPILPPAMRKHDDNGDKRGLSILLKVTDGRTSSSPVPVPAAVGNSCYFASD